MSDSLRDEVIKNFGEPKTELNAYSPLTLAFTGDAVYSLIIREIVVNLGNRPNLDLHEKTKELVSAKAQSKLAAFWLDKKLLTEEEEAIYKRGKNAKPKSRAKNQTDFDYHRATGVEALCGYLYEKGETARIVELLKAGIEI